MVGWYRIGPRILSIVIYEMTNIAPGRVLHARGVKSLASVLVAPVLARDPKKPRRSPSSGGIDPEKAEALPPGGHSARPLGLQWRG